jgi:hypothetical protein
MNQLCLGMVLTATQACRFIVRGLPLHRISYWKQISYSLVRHMSMRHEFIDSKASLSSYTTLQNEYKLPQTSEDRLQLRNQQRLVCVGDIHGDVNVLKKLLQISKVYDGHRWIGGDTILVQCGDVLDRGSQELECYSLLTRLSREAQYEGGRLILLWGNHEVSNAVGKFHATTGDSEYEEIVGSSLDSSLQTNRWRLQFSNHQPARWVTYEPGGLFATSLLANMKVAVQVGKTVCVHAGLTKQHLIQWGGLEGMNRMAREWIMSRTYTRKATIRLLIVTNLLDHLSHECIIFVSIPAFFPI